MTVTDKANTQKVTSSLCIADIFISILKAESEVDQDKEHFWAMGLNSKNQIKYIELVALGSLTSAIVHPRETFRFAVMKGVASIVVVHNHPCGDPDPSREDKDITGRLKQAGDILGIKLLDHVIIGTTSHFSFANNKML